MEITTQILRRRKPAPQARTDKSVSTGSTLFNLALSDRADGGIPVGKLVNLIGDSSSGKTVAALNLLAEAANDPRFDKHRLYFDDVEAANEFDVAKMFGAKAAERIRKPPCITGADSSETVEDFHLTIMELFDRGRPFIYVVDSWDALTSKDEMKRIKAEIKAAKAGKTDLAGSYRMEKAKKASEILRTIVRKLKASDSIVIVISQTRDKIDPMSFEKKTRAGGRALKFYSTFEIWMAMGGKVKSHDLTIGTLCCLKVTKNKYTGKQRDNVPPIAIYYSYGMDDIGSCIDYLLGQKVWRKRGSKIVPVGLPDETPLVRKKLIRTIEDENLEGQLRTLVERQWLTVEELATPKRKARYQ